MPALRKPDNPRSRQGCRRYFSMPTLSGFHSRGYLPHLKAEGRAYFVTFRLADSLPHEVIVRLKAHRADLLRRAEAEHRDSDDEERQALHRWYAEEVDRLLDRSTGENWLRHPGVADLVAQALRHFDGERYQLQAWTVMPNHVHVVVRPFGDYRLETILHTWKSFTAQHANRLLDRVGRPFWQRESYDHLIRDDADLTGCCHYTEENPVKAGLCARPADWVWSSAHRTEV